MNSRYQINPDWVTAPYVVTFAEITNKPMFLAWEEQATHTTMTRAITIQPVLNGFVCHIGCQNVVFADLHQMVVEIENYYLSPCETERRYKNSAVNNVGLVNDAPAPEPCDPAPVPTPCGCESTQPSQLARR